MGRGLNYNRGSAPHPVPLPMGEGTLPQSPRAVQGSPLSRGERDRVRGASHGNNLRNLVLGLLLRDSRAGGRGGVCNRARGGEGLEAVLAGGDLYDDAWRRHPLPAFRAISRAPLLRAGGRRKATCTRPTTMPRTQASSCCSPHSASTSSAARRCCANMAGSPERRASWAGGCVKRNPVDCFLRRHCEAWHALRRGNPGGLRLRCPPRSPCARQLCRLATTVLGSARAGSIQPALG